MSDYVFVEDFLTDYSGPLAHIHGCANLSTRKRSSDLLDARMRRRQSVCHMTKGQLIIAEGEEDKITNRTHNPKRQNNVLLFKIFVNGKLAF